MESFHSHRSFNSIETRGFTLVELLVVLAIIITITGVIFSSQSSFNKTLILSNTAYDVALSLRSAETYGLSSRAAFGVTNAGYGIHFQTGGVFTLFADTYPGPNISNCHGLPTNGDASSPNAQPGNCSYDVSYGTNQSERVIDYTLGNGITITDFCVLSSGWKCVSTGAVNSLDIVFARPNSDVFMSNGTYSSISKIVAACITLSSPQGGSKFVSVLLSGQISANATSCPLPS